MLSISAKPVTQVDEANELNDVCSIRQKLKLLLRFYYEAVKPIEILL